MRADHRCGRCRRCLASVRWGAAGSISVMDLSPQEIARRRQWLADVLCGRGGAGDVFPFTDAADAVALAHQEGVLALVAQGLRSRGSDDSLRLEFAAAARGATAIAMLRGAECER